MIPLRSDSGGGFHTKLREVGNGLVKVKVAGGPLGTNVQIQVLYQIIICFLHTFFVSSDRHRC